MQTGNWRKGGDERALLAEDRTRAGRRSYEIDYSYALPTALTLLLLVAVLSVSAATLSHVLSMEMPSAAPVAAVAAVAAVADVAAVTAAAETQVVPLRVGSMWPQGAGENKVLNILKDRVGNMTNGRIVMEIQPFGSTMDSQTFAKLTDGRLDGAVIPMYMAGKPPQGYNNVALVAGNGIAGAGHGIEQTTMLGWMFSTEGQATLERIYDHVNYKGFVSASLGSEMLGWCKKEYATYEEFKNATIRAPGGPIGTIYKKIMASPANVLGGGTEQLAGYFLNDQVDCFEWFKPSIDIPLLEGMGFDLKNSSYKNVYAGGLHQNSPFVIMVYSDAALARLRPSDYAVLKAASQASVLELWTQTERESGQILNHIAAGTDGWNGFHIRTTPAGLNRAFKDAALEVLTGMAATDSQFSNFLEQMKALNTDTSAWRSEQLQAAAHLLMALRNMAAYDSTGLLEAQVQLLPAYLRADIVSAI